MSRDGEIAGAFARLYAAEQARDAAIRDLVRLGVIRSKVLVGDLGEVIAAHYYGVDLAHAMTPGYDLTLADGRRVQVKAMRGNQGKRTILARQPLPETCDLLLAIRLADDYTPTEAIQHHVRCARSTSAIAACTGRSGSPPTRA